ncbi:hypothetical protein A2U01_0118769, partial [Trifolium medium]|nr:hypothetical protein [Trifolium medium]
MLSSLKSKPLLHHVEDGGGGGATRVQPALRTAASRSAQVSCSFSGTGGLAFVFCPDGYGGGGFVFG